MEQTTIAIDVETKELLDKLKVHPRATYDETIRNIIKRIKV